MLCLSNEAIEYACNLCCGEKQRFIAIVLKDGSREVEMVRRQLAYISSMVCKDVEYVIEAHGSLLQFIGGGQIRIYFESQIRGFRGYRFDLLIVDREFDLDALLEIEKYERHNFQQYDMPLEDLRYSIIIPNDNVVNNEELCSNGEQVNPIDKHNFCYEISDQEFFNILGIPNPQ